MSVLVTNNVRRTLFGMAWPMLAGTFAMNAYGLTDAYFVAKLGTLALAAMTFILPVIMLLTFVAGGLGGGVVTLMSHALGRHDKPAAARLVSHGIVLILSVAAVLAVAGYLSTDWLFLRLGAKPEALPLIRSYMSIWYFGAPLMAFPMLGNGLLIASGDSAAASGRMVLGAVINALLNPLLIHGYFGFPAFGIAGSALATVIAQAVSTVWLLWLLQHRHHLLKWHGTTLPEMLASFRRMLAFGIPGVASMILHPFAAGVVAKILSGFSTEAVAATGAAGRIEMLAFIIPMALGISLTPFVSQNFGAGRLDRIGEAFKISNSFALIYGAGIAVVYLIAAPWMASRFSTDPKVLAVLVAYIRITAIGYGMTEVHRYCTFFLTGMHKPRQSLVLDAVRVIVLLAPLCYLGSRLGGVNGVFWGRLITDVAAGCIGMLWVTRIRRRMALAAPVVATSPAAPADATLPAEVMP